MKLELASKYCIELGDEPAKFISNFAVFTWQVSHVWCVRDHVDNSQCVEQFVAKVFRCNPFSSSYVSERDWESRVDLPTWLLSLDVEKVDQNYLSRIISMARADLKLSEDEPEVIKEVLATMNSIKTPLHGWKIKETFDRRCPVGPTEIILFEADSSYFFLEIHNES